MLGGVVLNGLLGDPEQHGARILEFDMLQDPLRLRIRKHVMRACLTTS